MPGWVGTLSRLRGALNTALGDRQTLKIAPQVVADVDAEVVRLGRSVSARVADHTGG